MRDMLQFYINGEWVDPIIFFGEQETNQQVEADEGKEEWLDNTSD